jgi:hypothetical protein
VSRRLVNSLRPVLMSHVSGVLALESSTLHPQLNYCGKISAVPVMFSVQSTDTKRVDTKQFEQGRFREIRFSIRTKI